MAVTKIWAIKDSLSRVLKYAENPEKTIYSDLKQVLNYAENENKTTTGEEKMMYVSGVNCNKETAFDEMIFTQKRFGKTKGNVAYHAYQSFKTGEVTPELAHNIGVELARKMFPENQVIVATHFNTGTYHNHFVINSVNMFTGKKFNCNIGAYYKFREISDNICRENNLIVIENPRGNTPRNIYFAEKRGEPTKYNLMRNAINTALDKSISYKQFKNIMKEQGYIINDDYNRKYPTIRSINDKKATRLYRLGEEYKLDNIIDKINKNPYSKQVEYYSYLKKYKERRKSYLQNKESFSIKNLNSVEILFLVLLRYLGIYELPNKEYHKPLSPEMREAVRKMEMYSKENILIYEQKLETIDDVKRYIDQTQTKIDEVASVRQKYRNKLRNCTDENLINEYKENRNACTTVIQKERNNLNVAKQILKDIPEIRELISNEEKMMTEELEKKKNKNYER